MLWFLGVWRGSPFGGGRPPSVGASWPERIDDSYLQYFFDYDPITFSVTINRNYTANCGLKCVVGIPVRKLGFRWRGSPTGRLRIVPSHFTGRRPVIQGSNHTTSQYRPLNGRNSLKYRFTVVWVLEFEIYHDERYLFCRWGAVTMTYSPPVTAQPGVHAASSTATQSISQQPGPREITPAVYLICTSCGNQNSWRMLHDPATSRKSFTASQ